MRRKDLHVMNIIFDLDDTLYDLSEPFRRTHAELFGEQLGEECEDLFRMSRIYSDEAMDLEKEGKLRPEDAFFYRIHKCYMDAGLDLTREMADVFEEKYRYYQKHITVPDKIKEMLDYCRRTNCHMGVLTNGKVRGQYVKVEALGLLCWFEERNIFISEMTGYHKPAPAVFQYVEQHLKLDAKQIWYVGDTYEVDVIGGKNAGWNVIWYNHRRREVPGTENLADVTVYTAEELLDEIAKINSKCKAV